MPSHLLPTDHPLYAGTSASIGIRIAGSARNTAEYPFTKTCSRCRSYVASVPGHRYSVHLELRNPNSLPPSLFTFSDGSVVPVAEVRIDGRFALASYLLPSGATELGSVAQGSVQRSLVFAKPRFVEEGGLQGSDADAVGKIEVAIWLAVVGSVGENAGSGDAEAASINERAKKGALISALTKFSEPAPTTIISKQQTRLSVDPILTHTFHYKNKEFLELDGIIPQSETHTTRGTAASIRSERPLELTPATCSIISSDHTPPVTYGSRSNSNVKLKGNDNKGESDDAIVFMGIKPIKKRSIEVIDLTGSDDEDIADQWLPLWFAKHFKQEPRLHAPQQSATL
ncbi:hypothetical protein BC830DRAFT_1164632 [Chytriomyces sp. MP71]|nr:hypothetical protein BC830DRAFT_1164632 [Chytriomyces sp. MP71]